MLCRFPVILIQFCCETMDVIFQWRLSQAFSWFTNCIKSWKIYFCPFNRAELAYCLDWLHFKLDLQSLEETPRMLGAIGETNGLKVKKYLPANNFVIKPKVYGTCLLSATNQFKLSAKASFDQTFKLELLEKHFSRKFWSDFVVSLRLILIPWHDLLRHERETLS